MFDYTPEAKYSETSSLAKLNNLLPDDEHKMDIINYYNKHVKYMHGISASLSMLDYFSYHKDKTYNVVKTTRAGFTTNCILSSLFLNKRILLVAPTNKILYETVHEAYKLFIEISKTYGTKLVRPIPNNKDGCSCVVKALKDNPQLSILPYISSSDCVKCSSEFNTFPLGFHEFPFMSNLNTCVVKTMLAESDRYVSHYPDILTITYDKFSALSTNSKDTLFKELISKVDIIVFDELGDYLSKSYNGFEFYTETSDSHTTEKKDHNFILNYLVERVPFIKNTSSKTIMLHLLKTYIFPFVEKTFIPATSGKYPRLIVNPLAFEPISEKIPIGPVTKIMSASKQYILSKKYREYYQVIESMTIDNEPPELITLLIKLLDLMTKKQLLLYEQNTTKYNPRYLTIKSLFISNAKDELIENLNNWSYPGKIIIFSDATMPSHNLNRYTARKIKNIFYGDPANNNKSLLMFHDKTIQNFSKNQYFNNMDFRSLIFERLQQVLKLNYYGNEVIWAPSKDIAQDLSTTLNCLGIPTCSHLAPTPDAVMITYYGSTFTRGVKSERRYQILLGKASKPKNSFRHIAYMRRNDWSFLSEQDLNSLSAKEGVSYDDFTYTINDFNKDLSAPLKTDDFYKDITIYQDVPEVLTNYFNHLSNSIQKEKVYMDTWQAASRAKNPTGETRSVNICIGWSQSDVYELLQWGSNTSISYTLNNSKRLLKTQRNAIPIPNVLSNTDTAFIRHWLSGCEIPTSQIGFNENFIEGLRELVIEKESVSLEELWSAVQHNNIDFSHLTDTHTNGYLIGAVNSMLLYEIGEDIEVLQHTPINYTFSYNPTPTTTRKKKYHINYAEYLNILEILRTIYLFDSETVSYSDIRHNISSKKISTPTLHELWDIIISNNIFESSTWSIVDEKIVKTTSIAIEQEEIKKIVEKRFSRSPETIDLAEYIVDWYYNDPLTHEIDLYSIADDIPSLLIYTYTRDVITNFISSPEYREIVDFGLYCDIEQTPENIIFTRNTIVY